ncbi:hypothetical protein D0869_02863 [Hortaea werneckii]|uniref:GPI mannosyltransferase 1 n=1 Tax=Hortaea werneckii TaxID=91943 RepID=A0A3M6X773_HORWE|nr:hypothetical protein D0869_02863 [Hortaea werneckii]
MSGLVAFFFKRQWLVYTAAVLLRLALLVYGRWQDSNSPVKYTDIDYLVFTDAARYVSIGRSPYDRTTYRYTPLLAWLLYPTTWGGPWFEFGKCLFAFGDILTGFLIARSLMEQAGFSKERALKYASIWLLNPMVANISTRGSSEGLVVAMVVPILLQVLRGRIWICGFLLGVAVHVKIYPFIYAAAVFWWLGPKSRNGVKTTESSPSKSSWPETILELVNRQRQALVTASALAFTLLNGVMFNAYGMPFIKHTYLYHFTRLDHRHNFSVYNTVLHLNSAYPSQASDLRVESLAFIPQLLLAVVVIPLICAKRDLAGTMLAQTFAFVTFNKVCTSQVSARLSSGFLAKPHGFSKGAESLDATNSCAGCDSAKHHHLYSILQTDHHALFTNNGRLEPAKPKQCNSHHNGAAQESILYSGEKQVW